MTTPDFSRRVPSRNGRYLLPLYSNVLSSDSERHRVRGSERAFDITAHNKLLSMRPIADGVVFHIERLKDREDNGAGGYGENLIINHGDIFCWYCHLEFGSIRKDIKVGTRLKQDEIFARVGATGKTDFPNHTHLTFFPSANDYTRILPESIWDVNELCRMPFAKSSHLDKYEIRMSLNTILSVFMQGRGDMSYLSSLKPRVVKLIDAKQEEVDRIIALTPSSFIINRIFIDDSAVNAAIKNSPEGAAESHHALILSKGLTGVDYYQIQNEQLQHPPELALLNRYYVRLINLAVAAGYKTTVIDCSVGNLHVGTDHPGDWTHVFPTLELAQGHGFPVNVHQYSRDSFWNDKRYPAGHERAGEVVYNNDWYLHRLEHTAMAQLDRAGFNRLRYVVGEFGLTKLLAVAPDDKGFKGGWQLTKSHNDYRSDLIRVMDYLLQWSDRILGYCCYLTHAFSPWQTHEMFEMNKDLARYYNDNPQNIKPLVEIVKGNDTVLFKAKITAETLNVRSAPPVNGVLQSRVGQVHLNNIVDVLDISELSPDDWWKIEKGNLRGWSSSKYMEREQTLEQRVDKLEDLVKAQQDLLEAQHALLLSFDETLSGHGKLLVELDTRLQVLEQGNGGGVVVPDYMASNSIAFLGLEVEGDDNGPAVSKVFTTYQGQWFSRGHIFDIEDWARDLYLFSPDNPHYHDEAGGDHHMFVRVEDGNGDFIPNVDIVFTSINEGVDPTTRTTSDRHGWCNIPIFHPAQWYAQHSDGGQHMSAYTMPNADGTMPGREHVSLFVVLRA